MGSPPHVIRTHGVRSARIHISVRGRTSRPVGLEPDNFAGEVKIVPLEHEAPRIYIYIYCKRGGERTCPEDCLWGSAYKARSGIHLVLGCGGGNVCI